MAIRVLEETGLLPHLNPGVMSWEEMNRLKPVAPSMGMMLETTSRRLFEEKGEAHFGSPDKDPAVRLRVLEDAGRLSVPFTTGLLVGIGETLAERAETIFAIRASARRFGAVQEVIVQNFRAKPETAMRHADDLGLDEFRAAIAVTRLVLGPKMRVQAPPNLVDLWPSAGPCWLPASTTGAGSPRSPPTTSTPSGPGPRSSGCGRSRPSAASSCGRGSPSIPSTSSRVSRGWTRGSPATWPPWAEATTASRGPTYAHRPAVAGARRRLRRLHHGQGFGRTDLHTAVDTDGRTDDRRSDFDAVYGDWDALRSR